MKDSTNTVTIQFDDVEGIVQENFSQITYKGVNIGKVVKVYLNENKKLK